MTDGADNSSIQILQLKTWFRMYDRDFNALAQPTYECRFPMGDIWFYTAENACFQCKVAHFNPTALRKAKYLAFLSAIGLKE